MHSRTATARLLHTTARSHARLLNPSTSVSPDHGRATAPPPPAPVWKPSSARTPRPPAAPAPSATHKGPLRPDREAQALLARLGSSSPTPPPAPLRAATSRAHDTTAAAAAARREADLERAVTLDLFLLRTLAQLSERGARRGGAGPGPGIDLHTLLRQHREREGRVLSDATLSYEPTPGPARRVRLDGRAGSASGETGGVEEQDGTVVVAHVLGGKDPKVSVCSGFALGKSAGGEGQLILTAAHTLESVRPSLLLLTNVQLEPPLTLSLCTSARSCRRLCTARTPRFPRRRSSSPRRATSTPARRSPRPRPRPTSSSCASPPRQSTPRRRRPPLGCAPSPSTPTRPRPRPRSPSTPTSTRSRACSASSRASLSARGRRAGSPSTRTGWAGRPRSARTTSSPPCGSTAARPRGAAAGPSSSASPAASSASLEVRPSPLSLSSLRATSER